MTEREWNAIHLEVQRVNAAIYFLKLVEEQFVAAFEELLCECRVRATVGVGPEVHPNEGQRIWRVVFVHHRNVSAELVPLIVQFYLDEVVDLLLEVLLRKGV